MAFEDGVFPTFYMGTVHNRSESKKQKRKVVVLWRTYGF
jgi:hypothetical protein